jgi:hypothetical protein
MKIKILFIILFLLFTGFGTKVYADEICFTEEQAKKLVYELEQGKIAQDQVVLYKQENAELENQVKLLKEINDLKDQQIKINERTIEQYKDLIDFQKKSYEQIVKELKPSPVKQFLNNFGFMGIGLLIGLLL